MTITVSMDDIENIGIGEPRSYSGRGMYGKECLGLVGTISELVNFVIAVTQEVIETEQESDDEYTSPLAEFWEVISHVSLDSMGFDKIFYWPDVYVDGDSDY